MTLARTNAAACVLAWLMSSFSLGPATTVAAGSVAVGQGARAATATRAVRLPAAELRADAWSGGIVDNAAFLPGPDAQPAHEPFEGTLRLTESPMISTPARIASAPVLGRDPQVFPGVSLSFFTDQGDLVPFTQDLIEYASARRGKSFWDIIVQPGRVWSEPGDDGWSRAAFPFALVNAIEGETHNGIATFLYRGSQVSNLRYQIVQQTAPFYIASRFTSAGLAPARFQPIAGASLDAPRRLAAAERRDAIRIDDWRALAAKVGASRLEGFDGTMNRSSIVLAGLDYRGTFYLEQCPSAGGPLPWCERARFGVWSATKALANEAALLHLAQKYGPGVFDLKIEDYVPEAAAYPAWREVRFRDAIDMATGIGNGSTRTDPNHISDGYIDATYARWYEAPSVKDKIRALLEDGRPYPWGPAKVVRYRDQDMFILGVAMDRYLKSKEGPASDLWSMLEHEVFEPIGIHAAPTNRTLEPDGSQGLALMAYGYYPNLTDLVRMARLYQNGGAYAGRHILYSPRVHELLAGPNPRGRPTGEQLEGGETTYAEAFWFSSFLANGGCRVYYPRMIGWGGNIVALFPKGVTGIRLAKADEDKDPAAVETAGMARVADGLESFCEP